MAFSHVPSCVGRRRGNERYDRGAVHGAAANNVAASVDQKGVSMPSPYDATHAKATRNPLKQVVAVLLILLMLAVAVLGVGGYKLREALQDPITTVTESTDSKVIQAISREEQVVLVSLGIQGLHRTDKEAKLWKFDVPWSERTQLIQYDYKAKLGIEGRDVRVVSTGEHAYRVNVPEFIFIGHSDEHFETVIEDNGVLSILTDDIDAAAAVTEVLNDDEKNKQLTQNRELLEEQATNFYEGIITGIDPDAVIDVRFAG